MYIEYWTTLKPKTTVKNLREKFEINSWVYIVAPKSHKIQYILGRGSF
jgi:hypothetical protein